MTTYSIDGYYNIESFTNTNNSTCKSNSDCLSNFCDSFNDINTCVSANDCTNNVINVYHRYDCSTPISLSFDISNLNNQKSRVFIDSTKLYTFTLIDSLNGDCGSI